MNAVELNLDRLAPGRSTLEFEADLVREDQVLEGHRIEGFSVKVRGELAVDAMDHKILVHGSFRAEREMVCDRCGEPIDLEYPVEIEILVLRQPGRGTDAGRGSEVGEDDNWVIHQPQGVVDLTEALLEAVVLDEPQHVAHPEHAEPVVWSSGNDPAGDAADDGDEEIDPRWAALRQLRDDTKDDSGPVRN